MIFAKIVTCSLDIRLRLWGKMSSRDLGMGEVRKSSCIFRILVNIRSTLVILNLTNKSKLHGQLKLDGVRSRRNGFDENIGHVTTQNKGCVRQTYAANKKN